MTYFADLTPYTYCDCHDSLHAVNVGWLDKRYAFQNGAVSDAFYERIWGYCNLRIALSRGFHLCDLCTEERDFAILVRRGEESLVLGTAEIRVFGANGQVYASPDLIYHYITAHAYRPPDEFIEAVLSGPRPGSQQHMDALRIAEIRTVEPLREIVGGW